MYFIDCDRASGHVDASIGGVMSPQEATVFCEELRGAFAAREGNPFEFTLDYSRATLLDEGVQFVLARILADARESGANKVTFISNDEREAERWTSMRLQQVLEGAESYVAA
jgi:hypothetical protein